MVKDGAGRVREPRALSCCGPDTYWTDHAERHEATSVRYRRALLAALDLAEQSAVLAWRDLKRNEW